MNKYESVIIVNPNIDEAGLKALEEKFTGLINENGKVESVENMGKKRLAYEIKKFKEGTYMLFNFEANPLALDNIFSFLLITVNTFPIEKAAVFIPMPKRPRSKLLRSISGSEEPIVIALIKSSLSMPKPLSVITIFLLSQSKKMSIMLACADMLLSIISETAASIE